MSDGWKAQQETEARVQREIAAANAKKPERGTFKVPGVSIKVPHVSKATAEANMRKQTIPGKSDNGRGEFRVGSGPIARWRAKQGDKARKVVESQTVGGEKKTPRSTVGDQYAKSLEARGRATKAAADKKIQKAADRRTRTEYLKKVQNTPGLEREHLEADRAKRVKNHEYKGKYYGPDAFKGDMDKLRAWRAAGSPKDTKAFAKKK